MMRGAIILALCCLATIAGAQDRYIFIGYRTDMTAQDKTACRVKIKQVLNDVVEIQPTNLPLWAVATNTNIQWRILCVDKTKPASPIPPLSITKAQLEVWKNANLAEPNKLQVLTGGGVRTLIDAGLTPIMEPLR